MVAFHLQEGDCEVRWQAVRLRGGRHTHFLFRLSHDTPLNFDDDGFFTDAADAGDALREAGAVSPPLTVVS